MLNIMKFMFVTIIAFIFAFMAFDTHAGELSFTFDPPTTRVPSPDYPNGKPLDPSEIDHYNGVIRFNAPIDGMAPIVTPMESTFTVPGDATSFVLPGLVAGEYCVKLSTTDTEDRTDGFSDEKCKTVPAGPLSPPAPPVLHDDITN